MPQSQVRISKHLKSSVQLSEPFAFVCSIGIGMQQTGTLAKSLLDCTIIEMGLTALPEQREIISHAAKLSPQEQCATAFGFVTLNPPFCRSSLKSSSEPLTNNALFGSITTRTFDESTRMSRGAGPSTKSILYLSPEQPPPMTATRNAP